MPFAGFSRVEGFAPDILDAGPEGGDLRVFLHAQHVGEGLPAGQVVVQGTHADADGQLAMARRALEGALGDIAPGGGQVLQEIDGGAGADLQRQLGAILWRFLDVFLERIHQHLRVDADAGADIAVLEQRAVARRAVHMGGDDEQRRRELGVLQADQFAPRLEHLRQAGDTALAHLVAAGAAHQQGDQVGLLDGQFANLLGQVVAHGRLLQAEFLRHQIELMQLQPEAFGNRAVQLRGADQRGAEAADRPLQGEGERLRAFAFEVGGPAHDDQFVADCQMVLQRLAEAGDLARTLVEDDRLLEEIAFQVMADRVDFRAQQFEQLQTRFGRQLHAVQLDQPLVEQARGFPEVGLGQVVQPILQLTRRRVAEAQAFMRGGRNTQKLVRTRVVHDYSKILATRLQFPSTSGLCETLARSMTARSREWLGV
ncbi:hypothetical protein D3C76_671870 [compost metagenome]